MKMSNYEKKIWKNKNLKFLVNTINGHTETLALIVIMENYINEINNQNPKKKKNAWSAISSHLETENVTKTADMCRLKWKNLLRSYGNCKSSNNKTGRRPSRFLYFNEIDQLVGKKPNFSSPHSFNVLSPHSASTSRESSPALEDTSSSTKESEPETPKLGSKRKQSALGITALKKKLLEKKINELEAHEAQKKEKICTKMQLLERKILVDERKCQLLERYLNLKEKEINEK